VGKRAGFIGWLGALVVVVAAIVLSHLWDEDAGVNPVYVVLLLAVVSLVSPTARELLREGLRRMSKISFGGVEITLQVADAVAATESLPLDGEEDDGERELKIVDDDWRTDPEAALAKLQDMLDRRLRWIEAEIYAKRIASNAETLDKLWGDRLIDPSEQRIATTVAELKPDDLKRSLEAGGETRDAAVAFVKSADRVVNQLRLIAFDALVRRELLARGMKILELRDQPAGRWPDFYAFGPGDRERSKKPMRITVRMAIRKDGELIEKARSGLRESWPETPLDESAQRVIVFPQGSLALPPEDAEIPALRYQDFLAFIDEED
jgi:hypothetical protein